MGNGHLEASEDRPTSKDYGHTIASHARRHQRGELHHHHLWSMDAEVKGMNEASSRKA